MFVKNLDKRLVRLASKREKQLKEWIKQAEADASDEIQRHNWTVGYKKRLNNPLADVLQLRYLKRRGVFVNYKESCMFDPKTGYGYSYGWYTLSKVIKDKLVLNTYAYSHCTSKHISKFRRLFVLLGLKYMTIEAPEGLQNTEVTKAYQATLYARAEVANKYARKPSKGHSRAQAKLLANAKLLGVCPSQKEIKKAVKTAEANRCHRLDHNKMKRAERKMMEETTNRMTTASDGHVNPFVGLKLVKE